MVLNAVKRLFGKGHDGPSNVTPEQAELRLKGLKAKLVKNKSEAKRITSDMNLGKNVTAERKAQGKARLKELEAERKELTREMKALHKRLPKK